MTRTLLLISDFTCNKKFDVQYIPKIKTRHGSQVTVCAPAATVNANMYTSVYAYEL